jgi:Phage phiEco32-like COOH.NH2 ligase-type 2
MNAALTYGHDSEYALSQGGVLLSALDVLPSHENEYGRIFPDNMNAEIAINPVTTLKDFHANTEGLLKVSRDMGFDHVYSPSVVYPESCLSNPDAFISGCNPDHDGYTQQENVAPDFEGMDGTRSCGAHVHASIADLGLCPFSYARWFDIFAALPLLFLEEASNRRSLYGAAGCLRVKEYGVECRTLSNVWIHTEERREFVWEAAHKAVEACGLMDADAVDGWQDVQRAINTHDLGLATQCIDRLYIYGVKVL